MFTVRSVHQEFADVLRWHLAPFAVVRRPFVPALYAELYVADEDADLDPVPWSFFIAGERRMRDPSLAAVLAHAVWDIQALVPRLARDFLCVHAGVVARGDAAIVMPGSMEHGKSTLVAALLQRGCDYLSDEVAAIDPVTSRVYPFARHVKLDHRALPLLPGVTDVLADRMYRVDTMHRYLRPHDVGSRIGGPSAVRAVVFPTPDFDGPPRLVRLSAAEAVHRMVFGAFNLFRYQERGTIVLGRVVADAECCVLEGGTPTARAELLDGLLG